VRELSGNRVAEQREYTNPMSYLSEFMARFKVPEMPGLPRFTGGLVGAFGYDTVRYVEPKLADTEKLDPLELPDILLLLSEELAIVDNLAGKLTLVVYADPAYPGAWKQARARLKALLAKLREPVRIPDATPGTCAEAVSGFGQEPFKAAVQRAKDYITEGDIMQVVLSQRLSRPFSASPMSLYRALRALNPSPYMFYFDFGDFHVVGASPEILVRLEHRTVTLRPIAARAAACHAGGGLALDASCWPTKRSAPAPADAGLGRIDVGSVPRPAPAGHGPVTIDRYSHVMHIAPTWGHPARRRRRPVGGRATFRRARERRAQGRAMEISRAGDGQARHLSR